MKLLTDILYNKPLEFDLNTSGHNKYFKNKIEINNSRSL